MNLENKYPRGVSRMSKKRNTDFLEAYVAFETVCSDKFGLRVGGATEYINRLIRETGAPKRDSTLPKLVSYRNIRNRMAHEHGALAKIKDIGASDVRWLKDFTKRVAKGKDPVSVCESKKGKNSKFRSVLNVLIAIVACVAIAVAVLVITGKI